MIFTTETRSLVLNGATLGASSSGDLAAFCGRNCLTHVSIEGLGATGALADHCKTILKTLEWDDGPELIIAVLGPGSFTGLRASLALANGLAFGFGSALRGVTTGACFRSRAGWEEAICLTQARRDRLFVEWPDGHFWAGAPDVLNIPSGALLVGSGVAMMQNKLPASPLGDRAIKPDTAMILEAGLQASDSAMLEPLYVDAPEAKLPARGLRPAPLA